MNLRTCVQENKGFLPRLQKESTELLYHLEHCLQDPQKKHELFIATQNQKGIPRTSADTWYGVPSDIECSSVPPKLEEQK